MYIETLSVLILGHSFVRRLEQFCLRVKNNHNMCFDPDTHLIFYKSRGGSTIDTCINDFKVAGQVDANIVILDIGTNDLDNPDVDPLDLASRVVSAAKSLPERYPEVQVVVILECLFRSQIGQVRCRNPNFATHCYQYNNKVKELVYAESVRSESKIRFWHHRGMVDKWATYLSDGVHLNRARLEKYYTSLRRGILKFSPWVRERFALYQAKEKKK